MQQGKLSLDENVNDKLKSWQVPDNEFTEDQKVTLRRILSHSAGLTVHGFPGYAVGAPIPTLVQILNGESPANTKPVRVDTVPGTKFIYSGGGVTIEQQLLIDVTGKPFSAVHARSRARQDWHVGQYIRATAPAVSRPHGRNRNPLRWQGASR